MSLLIGVNNVAKESVDIKYGLNGVAKTIGQIYYGVNGNAELVYNRNRVIEIKLTNTVSVTWELEYGSMGYYTYDAQYSVEILNPQNLLSRITLDIVPTLKGYTWTPQLSVNGNFTLSQTLSMTKANPIQSYSINQRFYAQNVRYPINESFFGYNNTKYLRTTDATSINKTTIITIDTTNL